MKSHQRPKSRPTAAWVATLREIVARFKVNIERTSAARSATAGAAGQKVHQITHCAAGTVTKGDSPEAQIPLDGRDGGFESF